MKLSDVESRQGYPVPQLAGRRIFKVNVVLSTTSVSSIPRTLLVLADSYDDAVSFIEDLDEVNQVTSAWEVNVLVRPEQF